MLINGLIKLFRSAVTRRRGPMGVVTGCDAGAEWMLEWWYENLRRYNDGIPVCFADFGMSRPMRAWCTRHGEVIDLRSSRGVQSGAKSWFKKPAAIVKSCFEKVIWLDTDCEVLGSLGEYFAYCDVDAIGLTYDVRTNLNLEHCKGTNGNLITEPFQSGVVVARPDNELIVEWADRCAGNPAARGDQEVLIALIVERIEAGNSDTRIRVMPPEYQWLRLQGAPPVNARVMHWTGPAGKERIREKIAAALERAHVIGAPGRLVVADAVEGSGASSATRYTELYRGALQRHENGDVDGALQNLQEAVELKHDSAEAHVLMGRLYDRLGRIEEASDHYLLATHHGPDLPEAWLRLGQFAQRRGNLDVARGHLEKAVALQPASATAHNALGAVLYGLDAVEAAYARFQRAVELEPDFAEAHSNLGYTLFRDLERIDEGVRHIQTALELAPGSDTVLVNWAMVLQHRGEWQASLELCNRLLTHNPELHEVRCNRGLILLTRGDFRRGWLDYEARRHLPHFPGRDRRWPEWDGSPLSDKVVLVYGEQGLGDQIMFASCLPDVIRAARGCVVECNPKLEALLRRSFPEAQVNGGAALETGASGKTPADRIDCQVAAGSLPLHLRAERSDFPRHGGYLKADPARVAYWKERLDHIGGTLKVGVSWRGGAPSTRRSLRSVALQQWRPILHCGMARFVSLQYDRHADELEAVRSQQGVLIHHWSDAIEDYDETAALVSALDLIITVQTAVAHLAGALGKATWVMIPAVPEWRYLGHGGGMPWYPAVRLFRQATLHDWRPVVERVGAELDQMIAGH